MWEITRIQVKKKMKTRVRLCWCLALMKQLNKKRKSNYTGKNLNGHFSKENTQMASRYMKCCSTSLIIREMQIKTKVSHLITPVRRFIIKKSTNNTCWWGGGEKGTILHCCWECKLVQSLWKSVWRGLKKLKTKPPYDPAICI